ncbi:MAG TPA: pyridoxamine 5'-phosphate oxidase [Candidatus Dormibacteraeota bacterium]|nr:pyridoxamine 5'-phosphate oxidase [Candidatus Dormibacteraeota bacterium]
MALLESRVPADPLVLFRRWYREAVSAGVPQPDAMALATSGRPGPSARMVLFKGIEEGAFIFYSNYESRKGRDLADDARAAIVFHWSATRHQVRVSGTVRRLTRQRSLAYFRSRPRGARLSALASRQSRVIPSRALLERAAAELGASHPTDLPLPTDWGGYALRPRWLEFWESREDRLHDRLRYVRRQGAAWRLERLAP